MVGRHMVSRRCELFSYLAGMNDGGSALSLAEYLRRASDALDRAESEPRGFVEGVAEPRVVHPDTRGKLRCSTRFGAPVSANLPAHTRRESGPSAAGGDTGHAGGAAIHA